MKRRNSENEKSGVRGGAGKTRIPTENKTPRKNEKEKEEVVMI